MSKGAIKLVYYFNTVDHLEVQNASNGDWVQVTCNWFRSYAGNRRINGKTYEGPMLYEGTNFLYDGPLTGKLLNIEEVNVETCGIHYYGGYPGTKEFNMIVTENNYEDFNNIISHYIGEVLK